MTGSRVKQIEKYVDDDDLFMVTYGDGLVNMDIPKLLAFHRSHGRLATVTTVNPTSRFGLIQSRPDGLVESFEEKPHMHSWISAGYFVFDKRVFSYIDSNPACTLEKEPMERLVRDKQLMAYRHDGFFYAMDTYRDSTFLNALWNQRKAPWALWDKTMNTSSSDDAHVSI
jgi:glucose-1-phosphate cytidylyltransferase